MAKQSDDETDRASGWSPGRTHWWTTTAIAIIGSIVGGTSLIMNFFYHPSAPPITIDSGHSEFMKLSYADRIDRCVPYISEHLDEWRDKWRTALDNSGGSHQNAPVPYAGLWRRRRGGPGNREHLPRGGELRREDRTYRRGRESVVLRVRTRAENGPEQQLSGRRGACRERRRRTQGGQPRRARSPLYDQGEFAGVTAEGRPSKIVEVVIRPGQSESHRELGFAIVGSHDQGVRMWVLNASVNAGSQEWMKDIQNYRGF